MTKLSTVSSH